MYVLVQTHFSLTCAKQFRLQRFVVNDWLKNSTQACRPWGCQVLVAQLTLSQPGGGQIMPTKCVHKCVHKNKMAK